MTNHYLSVERIAHLFKIFTSENNFGQVERSTLVSPFFKDEFNISGAHGYLIPALKSKSKLEPKKISVSELCIRKTDSEIIGISSTHLLTFEMGVFGTFGYIPDRKTVEGYHISLLLDFLELAGINKSDLLFTVSDGGNYLNQKFERDHIANEVLIELGISTNHIIFTKGRRNFMLSRGVDRLSGYNLEIFLPHSGSLIEVASVNCYQYLNQITHFKKTVNTGVGCGIGLDRLSFISSKLESIYELPLFRSIANGFESELGGSVGSVLVRDKLSRIIELSKTLIMIFNDGYDLDNSPQGKTMKSYLAKASSEIDYLNLDFIRFCELLGAELRNHFKGRYEIKESAVEKFKSYLAEKLHKRFSNELTTK